MLTSCGGTSNDTVLRSIARNESVHGMMKNIPNCNENTRCSLHHWLKLTRSFCIAFFYPTQSEYDSSLIFWYHLEEVWAIRYNADIFNVKLLEYAPSLRRTLKKGKIGWSTELRRRQVILHKILKTLSSQGFRHLQFDPRWLNIIEWVLLQTNILIFQPLDLGADSSLTSKPPPAFVAIASTKLWITNC